MLKTLKVNTLHAAHEVGASAEKRYEIASTILNLALSSNNRKWQHDTLHKALDVLLCEGKFESIPFNDPLHRQYWELGHSVASEILKHQDYVNIQSYWFSDDYESAKEELKSRGVGA